MHVGFKRTIKTFLLLVTALLLIGSFALAPFAYAQTDSDLTQQQEQYLDGKGRVLKYAHYAKLPPMEWSKDNQPRGIIVDIVNLIAQKSGFEVQFVSYESDEEVFDAVREGKADFCTYESETVNAPNTCSDIFLSVPLAFVRSSSNSKPVAKTGTVKKYNCITRYVEEINSEQVHYASIEECLDALKGGKIDQAIISAYAANYYLPLSKYSSLTKMSYPDKSINQLFWVGDDLSAEDAILLSILNKQIAKLNVGEITEIVAANSTNEQLHSFWELLSNATVEVMLILFLVFGAVIACLVLILLSNRRLARETENILFTDELTGLLSKKGFEKKAKEILSQRPNNVFYIMDFDVDRFEHYNAINGFEAGDKLLQDIAYALGIYMDKYEISARYDADHFVVLMENPQTGKLMENVELFNSFVRARHIDYSVKLSFGIYKITDVNLHVGIMVDRAVAARRLVKGARDKVVGVYDEKLYEKQTEEALLISQCELAIANKEFIPYYQPKVDICKGVVVGYEALARWRKPDGSILPPSAFIQTCEKAGLIGKLDFLIYEQVCADIAMLSRRGVDMKLVSVNFSRANMYDSQFVKKLAEVNRRYGVSTGLIEIEVTESMFVGDHDIIKDLINNLHHAGFTVSIDDFGSGYSALNLLIDSNFDIVKLDRTFFTQNASSVRGHTVVDGIIDLAKKLGLKTVAEGVETKRQLEFLQLCGCDVAQGFFYSRPVELEKAVAYAKDMASDNAQQLSHSQTLDATAQRVTEERIRSSIIMDKQRFKTVYDTLPIGLSIWSTEINKVYELNAATCKILDRTEEELLSTNWRTFVHPNDLDSVTFTYDQLWKGKKNRIDYTLRFYKPSGKMIWTEVTELSFGYNEQGDRLHLMVLNDITQKRLQEEQLRISEQRYSIIEQAIGEYIFDYQVQTDTFTVPPKGKGKEIVIVDFFKNFANLSLVHKDDKVEMASKLRMCIDTVGGVNGKVEYRSLLFGPSSGYVWCRCYYTPICDNDGNVLHLVGRIENIDEEKKSVLSLQHEVNLDPLTKLYNKEYTRILCEKAAANRKKNDSHVAMMIDLDDFRVTNAQKGHLVGDQVIRAFAAVLKAHVPSDAILGRVGGDEFLIWLPNATKEDAKILATRLITASNKLGAGQQDLPDVEISVGIAALHREDIDSAMLISRADAAMYRAKNNGKNQYAIYTRDFQSKRNQFN